MAANIIDRKDSADFGWTILAEITARSILVFGTSAILEAALLPPAPSDVVCTSAMLS
jgi:hypothetical protein